MIALYLLFIYNLLVFLTYGFDKFQARRDGRRTPEATLLWLTALAGGPGALVAMQVFRHKTRKFKFRFGVPVLTALQVSLALWGQHQGWW